MLVHLRLSVPSDLSDEVTTALSSDDSVANLSVLSGASVKPAGDVIEADIARESASGILDALEDLGLGERGGIVLSQPIGTPFEAAKRAEEHAAGDPDDAVIWELVHSAAESSSRPTFTYLALLIIATALAAIAVLTDSSVLVVGAMVVGPEFATVAAVCAGVALGDWKLAARSGWLLLWAFLVAIGVMALISVAGLHLGFFTEQMVTRPRPQTGFIWRPDKWSFIVALWAGAAGVLAIATEKASAMVGVFISVTTVPAAGNVALGLAIWDMGEVTGSLGQLGVNIAGMVTAGILTLLLERVVWRRLGEQRRVRILRRMAFRKHSHDLAVHRR